MKKMIFFAFSFFVLMVLMSNDVLAQAEESLSLDKNNTNSSLKLKYINPKIGLFAGNTFPHGLGAFNGLQGGIELGISKNKLDFAISYSKLNEFVLFSEPASLHQLNLLAGKNTTKGVIRFQALGGLSYLNGHLGGEPGAIRSELENVSTIGLGGKIGLKLKVIKYFSLGLDLETYLYTNKFLFLPSISMEILLAK